MRGSVCDVLSKIVVLFLVFMAVLAMFGRLRYPGKKKIDAMRCPRCKKFHIGKGPCDCGPGGKG